jgi:hypothetical protein
MIATNMKQPVKQEQVKKDEGLKYDEGKTRFDLVDPEFEELVAKVMTFGANKYKPNSWQNVEDPVNRYYAALRRHINAWRKGEKIDPESKLPHLAHVAVNAMFLLHYETTPEVK